MYPRVLNFPFPQQASAATVAPAKGTEQIMSAHLVGQTSKVVSCSFEGLHVELPGSNALVICCPSRQVAAAGVTIVAPQLLVHEFFEVLSCMQQSAHKRV